MKVLPMCVDETSLRQKAISRVTQHDKLTFTIQSFKNAEVLNILQASVISNTWQAVCQAAGFTLKNHRKKLDQ